MGKEITGYLRNIGNTMACEWYKGHRATYFKLQKHLQMAATGSKTKRIWGLGPFPTAPIRHKQK